MLRSMLKIYLLGNPLIASNSLIILKARSLFDHDIILYLILTFNRILQVLYNTSQHVLLLMPKRSATDLKK